ncbi:MAG: VWA-like domain-containing protein [Candidatus Methanomethylicaceae archaeon]
MNIAKIRWAAAKLWPWTQPLLTALRYVQSEKVGSMAVSEDWTLYYNESFISKHPPIQIGWVLIHELLHLLYNHSERGAAFPHRIRNLAADVVVNRDLLQSGAVFPCEDFITPEKLGLPEEGTFEQYLDLLRQQEDQEDALSQENGKASSQDGDGVPIPSPNSAGGADPLNGNDGSGAGGAPGEWEEKTGEASSLTETEKTATIKAALSRLPGYAPAELRQMAEQLLRPPEVPWQQLLKVAVRATLSRLYGDGDYTYSIPNRRSEAYDPFVLPALAESLPTVGIVFDTSGSMWDEIGPEAVSIVQSITRQMDCSLIGVGCDTEVHAMKPIKSVKDVNDLMVGGGGTDLSKGIVALQKRVDVIVVLTDGYTPWPDVRPPVPVIVLLTQENSVPTWAHKVVVRR